MSPSSMTATIQRLRQLGRVQQLQTREGTAEKSLAPHALELVGPVPMPVTVEGREVVGKWYVGAPSEPERRTADQCDHLSVVIFGEPEKTVGLPLVRIHSTCFTGDVLGSLRCDCGPQLQSALRQVSEAETGGMLVYMAAHEGRGIGLWSKAVAYLLQDEGLDTYEANRQLGFPDDERDFRYAALLIRHLLGDGAFRLLTNNPRKVEQMRTLGFGDVVQQGHIAGVAARNCRYISAKRKHGHLIPAQELEGIGRED